MQPSIDGGLIRDKLCKEILQAVPFRTVPMFVQPDSDQTSLCKKSTFWRSLLGDHKVFAQGYYYEAEIWSITTSAI